MPAFQLIMHSHKDVSLTQFQVNACLFNNIAKYPFTCFASRHIMKRYLALESKSLGGCHWPSPPGLYTDSFGLDFGICGLTASALWRIPLGAMTSVTF